MEIVATPEITEYYKKIEAEVEEALGVANAARRKGYDYADRVETTPVSDLADRAETLVGPKGVAKRYRELMESLEGEQKRIRAIFQIFREIIEQKLCRIPDEEKRIEQAIKTALVLYTDGVVVAPIDGIPKVAISKNPDGTSYIDIYYAGPIRAAGGTSQVLPLILGDYARKLLGLDRYKPTKDEIERYVEEIQIYDEIVSRQYKLTDEEIRKIIAGCPVCINGEPTEEREVSVHRDLPRIPHNRIRGGACLVISEGLALKARKALKFATMLGLDWSWLEGIIKHEKSEGAEGIEPVYKYLDGTAAGRPILSYPSQIGGFRLRYGRTRATGIMGKAMHPATLELLEGFIAIGTQIKIERPGKSAVITTCDIIEGPIVRLKDGEVVKVESAEQARKLKPKIDKILFLGDLLIAFGDFKYSAHPLVPAGYNEEWWQLELEDAAEKIGLKADSEVKEALKNVRAVPFELALSLSKKLNIPMHPKFTYYYKALTVDELKELIKAVKKSEKVSDEGKEMLLLENEQEVKTILEKIGVPHKIIDSKIALCDEHAKVFSTFFKNVELEKIVTESADDVNHIISRLSGIRIRDKAGTFIGARMGRPEASGERRMKGNPHTLFPIGNYGGNARSINKAMELSEKEGGIEIEAATFQCPKCKVLMASYYCHKCNVRTIPVRVCPKCKVKTSSNRCERCGSETKIFSTRKERLDLIIKDALERLGVKLPNPVKGVRGLMSNDKIAEPIEKGILRAKHNLHIFRDGTIRYDLINVPLTHFKPKEIGVSVEKLRELGYTKDIHGKELVSDEQTLELFPQDIIIHNDAAEFLVVVSRFIDEELEKFYGLKPFYNIRDKEGLIGKLVLALAPHTSAAIIGRIVGFTRARACFAHPYFHQTKRRNADGDQDSVMLLMDVLLNFSQAYLPGSRGGRMDAPLVFTTVLTPNEIDTEVYSMDICWRYPLELYEKSLSFAPPEAVNIECVENRLGTASQYCGFGYTHETSDFCAGPEYSTYVRLKTMEEKILTQAKLQSRIKAVNLKDSLTRVIETHLLPDIIGNTRAFSRQQFRCTNCNAKCRRIPLNGKCLKCGKENLILTIAQGSVEKYLEIAKKIAREYGLSDYLKQRVELIEEEIGSIFKSPIASQKSLIEFA
jgi:DNA polymerase II large subunit